MAKSCKETIIFGVEEDPHKEEELTSIVESSSLWGLWKNKGFCIIDLPT